MCVYRQALVAMLLLAPAPPPLKPNQPNHSMTIFVTSITENPAAV